MPGELLHFAEADLEFAFFRPLPVGADGIAQDGAIRIANLPGHISFVVETEDDAVLTNHLRRARVGSRYRRHLPFYHYPNFDGGSRKISSTLHLSDLGMIPDRVDALITQCLATQPLNNSITVILHESCFLIQ